MPLTTKRTDLVITDAWYKYVLPKPIENLINANRVINRWHVTDTPAARQILKTLATDTLYNQDTPDWVRRESRTILDALALRALQDTNALLQHDLPATLTELATALQQISDQLNETAALAGEALNKPR